MAYFETKDGFEKFDYTCGYYKLHGVYGYLVLTADKRIVFIYPSGETIVYDDVTDDFTIL